VVGRADGSLLQPSEYLTWEVQVLGVCPLAQVPLADPPWLCGCAAGTQPAGGSAGSGTVTCQPCPSGQLKDSDGNTGCNSCLDTIFRQRGDIKYANARTVTRAAGSTDIYDCGARIADFAFRNARTSFRNDCSSGKLAPQSARSWFTVVQAAQVAPL
jgi:hypothetical protein